MDKMIYLEIGKRVVLADPSCGVGFVTVHFNTEQYCNATADHRHKSKLCQVCLRKLHKLDFFLKLRFISGVRLNVKTYCSTINYNGVTSAVETATVDIFDIFQLDI